MQAWGPGGNGAAGLSGTRSGGGGGGGALGAEPSLGGVTPGSTTLTVTIGAGGSGTATTVTGGSVTVTGNAGGNASANTGGAAGAAGSNSQAFAGGTGGNGAIAAGRGGGGGGSSAGTGLAGANGGTTSTSAAGAGGTAPSGGGNGGNGGISTTAGNAGSAPGGGGGGGGDGSNFAGAAGADGQVIITWTVITISPSGYLAAASVMSGAKKAAAQFKGYLAALVTTGPQVVNQWSATFAQPAAFGTTPPSLQSLNVGLTPANSVGPGSGYATAGNWLVCIVGWQQASTASPVTVGDSDDAHDFWRPGDVTASNWAVSASAGKTRVSIWYTANTARQVSTVYVSPNGSPAGMSALVIEIAATGPWDVVTGLATGYAGAAASLNLALPAPSQASFQVAAVCGDSTAAGQAFAPSGWRTLAAVTASNGSDHTCDAVLTSAVLMTTTASSSVTATTASAADLSGVIIGFQLSAPSPVPNGQNPNWPYMIVEAAFGSGYQTPADQMTWTPLNNQATAAVRRFWAFSDSSGVPYGLGQLQSSAGAFTLSNPDGALCPWNSASPYYPHCLTGTPVRIRAAIGTIKGTTVNRWYVIQRNADEFPERRTKSLLDYVPLTTTDAWSVAGGTCPSPYRGEVRQDSPYAWWAMDDAPLSGGVQPTSLRNSAAGNTTVMTIYAASGGVTAGDAYTVTGTDATATNPQGANPGIAIYAAGQQQGWMYGDPQASQASYATGNPVTSSPGSAAWQQTGMQGSGGANGWFLACNDASFPVLSGGASFGIWFNAAFNGSSNAWKNNSNSYFTVAGQPYNGTLTIATLATASLPVAVLQLDSSGHLILTTYAGGTATAHMIYSSSDLRSASWHHVTLTTDGSNWACYLNGGISAAVSGTGAGMTSAWTWLIIGADCGGSGGSSLASAAHMGNMAFSHAQVFPAVLPAWRVRAHYCAAATGFGVLPAPQTVSLSAVVSDGSGSRTPDGADFNGSYGGPSTAFAFSAVVVAQAGSCTSGPSSRAVIAGLGQTINSIAYGNAVWCSWTGLAPSFGIYTASAANAEANAATACGSGDAFTANYGASATANGVCHVAGGTGTSPPSAPSSLGDTVAQRLERIMGYGLMTAPNRAIDATANLLVQAASDVGGQAAGAGCQNITDSDNGLLFVDTGNTVCYRSRPHLNADTAAWNIGMNVISGMLPFGPDVEWSSDPQKIWDAIGVTPYSPDGASLPTLTPVNATGVNAAQAQYGPRPKAVTSYLQSSTAQQSQADWFFAKFGSLQRRAKVITIDAATHPAAWPIILGANPGDLASVYDAPFGVPANTGTYRISQISRNISNGADGAAVEGKAVLVLDPLVTLWS